MPKMAPVSHDDRLSVVDHLDELRTRIIITIGAFVVAFALCFWQNNLVLDIANGPLPAGKELLTLSVAESFMTTLTISAYAAILITMPVIVFQVFSFVLPAFRAEERRLALPMMILMPLLFIAGVVFAYYIVAPVAVKFLVEFNADQFNVQLRARDYYSFVLMTILALAIVFQVPVVMVALTRLRIVSVKQFKEKRKIAYVIIAVVAAALPGTDPITMLIEMVPLLVLYELGLVLASVLGTPRSGKDRAEVGEGVQ